MSFVSSHKQFSHKQLVLVTSLVSTRLFFMLFLYGDNWRSYNLPYMEMTCKRIPAGNTYPAPLAKRKIDRGFRMNKRGIKYWQHTIALLYQQRKLRAPEDNAFRAF